MEDWTAGVQSALRKILEEIDLCDFFILLLGKKYGQRPPWTEDDRQAAPDAQEDWSYVVIEYEHARARKIPIIALLSDDSDAGTETETNGAQKMCEEQRIFRDKIRNTLSTKTWHNEGELRGHVTSSILARIRPLEAAVVVQTNADLVAEVSNYLNTQAAVNRPAQNAILIQYSSRNVRDIIRKLLWSGVRTQLFVVSKKVALKHQKSIVAEGLSALTNHLDPIDPAKTIDDVLSLLQIYRYDAPGSIRAISIDDKFLAIGTYVYMKKKRRMTPEIVDIRGGELPMVIFRSTHAGFPVLKGMLDGLLKNWQDKGIAKEWDKTQTDLHY